MPSSNKIIIDIYDDDNNDNKYNYYKNGDISIKCKNNNNFMTAQDSRRGETLTGHKHHGGRQLTKGCKYGRMAKHRICECKRLSYSHCKAYSNQTKKTKKSNNTHEDNGRISKAPKKQKRNSQSSDNEDSFEERNIKPEANAMRALNFHGYIYTNQSISGSSKDHNDDALIMSNKKTL